VRGNGFESVLRRRPAVASLDDEHSGLSPNLISGATKANEDGAGDLRAALVA